MVDRPGAMLLVEAPLGRRAISASGVFGQFPEIREIGRAIPGIQGDCTNSKFREGRKSYVELDPGLRGRRN